MPQPTLDNTVGAFFLGTVGSAFLYGFTTLQMYMYYHRWLRDSFIHKYSVGALWLLDSAHLALVIHAVYIYIAKHFGDLQNLETIIWSMKAQITINVVVVLLVQTLYTYRVWILGGYHHGILGYVVTVLLLAGFVVGTILAYKVCTAHLYSELEEIPWSINTSLATSTATDFLIAGAMCYYLRKSRSSHSEHMNSRISRLMQYTVSTGLFTSACSLSAMFCYILLPGNFIYLALQFFLTKVYVGSFFAMLNARQRTENGSSRHDLESSRGTQ
ncbi:hypothetical protein E4T56_gene8611, partial [Termitomyces sp. T112]